MQGADENDDGKEGATTAPIAAVDFTTRLLERLMERVEVLEQNQAGPSPKLVTPSMVPRQNRSNRKVPPPPAAHGPPPEICTSTKPTVSLLYLSIFECD